MSTVHEHIILSPWYKCITLTYIVCKLGGQDVFGNQSMWVVCSRHTGRAKHFSQSASRPPLPLHYVYINSHNCTTAQTSHHGMPNIWCSYITNLQGLLHTVTAARICKHCATKCMSAVLTTIIGLRYSGSHEAAAPRTRGTCCIRGSGCAPDPPGGCGQPEICSGLESTPAQPFA